MNEKEKSFFYGKSLYSSRCTIKNQMKSKGLKTKLFWGKNHKWKSQIDPKNFFYHYYLIESVFLIIDVYITSDKGWYNVEMHPVDGLRRAVVAGHSGQTDERQIVLASNLQSTLSMEQIISTLSIIEQVFHTNKYKYVF